VEVGAERGEHQRVKPGAADDQAHSQEHGASIIAPEPGPQHAVRDTRRPRRPHADTYLLIFVMVLLGAIGDLFLKLGMARVGAASLTSPAAVIATLVRAFTTPQIWLGTGCLILFFVSYLLALARADYSFVSPAAATSYAVVAVLAWAMLGEVITPTRWAGIVVICAGVLLVSHTPPRTTSRH
jgi:drug/metabolite transporter (DMT)-like permease